MTRGFNFNCDLAVVVLLIVFISAIRTTRAQRSPTISYISQEQIKDIGGTVDLDCSVLYAQDYPILWIKLDPANSGAQSLLISSGNTLIIRDSRFSLSFDERTSMYSLQIRDLQETDAGAYQCQILVAVNDQVSANVDVLIRIQPIISDNSTRSLVVSQGQRITLECYASGFPLPKISWRRENNAILPTGGAIFRGNMMHIPSIKKEDRGTYYCVAENTVGRGARRNINIEVEFAPVITVPRPRLGQALMYDMDLECHIVAYPPPAVQWLKDGIVLNNNQHFRISHFATADEFTDTTLRVITIEKKQFGFYTCRAYNKLGFSEAQLELQETVIPICPPACDNAYFTSRGAKLSIAGITTGILAALVAKLTFKYFERQST